MANKAINDLLKYNARLILFARPNLTSNGTLGGSSFAVWANGEAFGPAWEACDGVTNNDTSQWANSTAVGDVFKFYNPQALRVETIGLYFQAQGITAGDIYGSNDDSSYTLINSFSGLNVNRGVLNSVSVASASFYKYYKIICTAYSGRSAIGELTIPTAYYLQ